MFLSRKLVYRFILKLYFSIIIYMSSSQLDTLSNNFNQILSDYQNTYQSYTDSINSHNDAIFYSNKLKDLNNKLMDLNQQMMNIINNNSNNYQQNKEKQQEQEQILSTNYTILVKERSEIESIIRQYETLNSAYNDKSEIVSSNYLIYIVLLFISIVLIMLFFSISFSGQQRGGNIHNSLARIFKFK